MAPEDLAGISFSQAEQEITDGGLIVSPPGEPGVVKILPGKDVFEIQSLLGSELVAGY